MPKTAIRNQPLKLNLAKYETKYKINYKAKKSAITNQPLKLNMAKYKLANLRI